MASSEITVTIDGLKAVEEVQEYIDNLKRKVSQYHRLYQQANGRVMRYDRTIKHLQTRYNGLRKNSMSLENVQKMALELANQALTDGYQCSNDYTEADVVNFIEEWRKNNDC